jgi:DNA-binding response OmpR family regulator
MRILIVEDEVNVARVLEMRLERAGLKSFSTSLGEEAIELAAIYDYDLIVLDLNLPDMYGGDVLRALRNKRIATPVLVLTGDASTQHKLRCFELGADDFLPKPFHCDELMMQRLVLLQPEPCNFEPCHMKPRKPLPEQDDLLRARLVEMIDMRHELVKLAALIDWEVFEREWAGLFPSPVGRPATPTRLVAGLLLSPACVPAVR